MPRAIRIDLLAIVLALVGVDAAHAGFITYDLVNYPSLQNGWTLSGTITTDGTIGALSNSDVVAWAYSATKSGTTFSASSTESGASVFAQDLTASATQLTLADTQVVTTGFNLLSQFRSQSLGYGSPSPSTDPNYYYLQTPVGQLQWSTEFFGEPPAPSGGGLWVIAETPEPASILLVLTAIGGMTGYRLVTRRSKGRFGF
jgi:hypothetical protein